MSTLALIGCMAASAAPPFTPFSEDVAPSVIGIGSSYNSTKAVPAGATAVSIIVVAQGGYGGDGGTSTFGGGGGGGGAYSAITSYSLAGVTNLYLYAEGSSTRVCGVKTNNSSGTIMVSAQRGKNGLTGSTSAGAAQAGGAAASGVGTVKFSGGAGSVRRSGTFSVGGGAGSGAANGGAGTGTTAGTSASPGGTGGGNTFGPTNGNDYGGGGGGARPNDGSGSQPGGMIFRLSWT